MPEDVLSGQTVYWRVDEANVNGLITKGELWSFFVADYLVVDDMESSEPIWFIWLDSFQLSRHLLDKEQVKEATLVFMSRPAGEYIS